MLKLLHVSDIHFGKPHDPEVAEALLRSAHELAPDVLIASGDFTQRAKVHEYEGARDYLRKLPSVPKVVVPGNHDVPLYRVWERLTRPLGNYRRYIHQDLETTLEHDGLFVVALDSTSPWLTISRGRVKRSSVEFAREAFAGAEPNALKLLVIHHQLVPSPDGLNDRSTLGARSALREFAAMGVELVMSGHLHRCAVSRLREHHFDLPSDRDLLLVQSGTTTSRRGRGPERHGNSFNWIGVTEREIAVTHHLYCPRQRDFLARSRHVFPRPLSSVLS